MRRAGIPRHPGKVLTWALQLGLSATVNLMRERVTEETRHLYYGGKGRKGVRRIWGDAREKYLESKRNRQPNAIHLQKAEHNIRHSYNKLIFNTSVRYGNTEKKRKRRTEDRKYINILEDYLGARLRDMGADLFPFPPPVRMVLKNKDVTWVYPGNSRIPEYIPQHTAPEQDFVDMIRSHGIELIRQCLKYGVPIGDAKRYINKLNERLIPFLEYVYTGRKVGGPNFTHGAARELRRIVLELRAHYGWRNGRPQSVTGELQESHLAIDTSGDFDDQEPEVLEFHEYEEIEASPEITVEEEAVPKDFFVRLIEECDTAHFPQGQQHVEKVRELVGKKQLADRDAEYLHRLLIEESRRVGAAFHDFIANADITHRPFTLFGPVRYGDAMLSVASDFILASEIPVDNGRGRIDLVLFRKKLIETADESPSDKTWEPCAIFEIKTKSAFNLDMYAVPTRSKDTEKRVVEFDVERRRLTESEWDGVIASVPSDYSKKQIEMYEKLLLSDYQRIARTDRNPPEQLMKAVLVVDTKENWELVRDGLFAMIMDAYRASADSSLSRRELLQLTKNREKLHAGLVVFSDCEDTKIIQPERIEEFDPFRYSQNREDSREFVLYFTVSGKGSPQESSARIAAKWHGLEYIHQRVKRRHRNVIWFDFTGEYSDPNLREHRLRLQLHPKSIHRFLRDRVSFIDMSKDLVSHLDEGRSLRVITDRIRFSLENAKQPFIVVTGFDGVRRQIPRHRSALLDELVVQFIQSVPDNATVVWFDRPVPLSQTSQRFDTRCVAPFYGDSPWMYVVDTIVWNLPMSPPRFGSHVPVDDDIRLLVIERHKHQERRLIPINPLYKWGERFRPDKDREENIGKQSSFHLRFSYPGIGQGRGRHYDDEDIEASLELVPHISTSLSPDDVGREFDVEKYSLPEGTSRTPSLMSRVSFTPYQSKSSTEKDGRVKRLEPLRNANHPREYRDTHLYGKRSKMNTRPPHTSLLMYEERNKDEVLRRELSGIRRTIQILRRRFSESAEWIEFLNTLYGIANSRRILIHGDSDVFNVLRDIPLFLETADLSKDVWQNLKAARSWIPREISQEQTAHMKALLSRDPDILLITGNELFLLLLASLYEAGHSRPPTGLVEKLWEYLLPWQLVELGFTPHYHTQHLTGESVFHRTKTLEQLIIRTRSAMDLAETNGVSEVLFGKGIPVKTESQDAPVALWIAFQSKAGSHEMNASLIPLRHTGSEDPAEILHSLPREKPYWGETELSNLGILSRGVNVQGGVPIMIARHHGLRGIWVLNHDEWSPVGRIDYFTRRRESVTLLRSFTLRQDSSMQVIERNVVRAPPRNLDSNIEVALGTISVAFHNCITVRCRVSIDTEERMFRLSFLDHDDENAEVGRLPVRETVDVLEILRRPDFECEPVIIDGKKLIWNRFSDIEYEEDAVVLQPWVVRKDPLKTPTLSLPSTANHLLDAARVSGLRLTVHHDPYACPVRGRNLKSVINARTMNQSQIEQHLSNIEGPLGQPDTLYNESIHSHGNCWKVQFTSRGGVCEEIRELEKLRLSGPALSTLLETGVLSYQREAKWTLHEFIIPESKDLPREFRESIHLMRWQRDKAALPGQYLLESWAPGISIFMNRVEFRLVSQVTGEVVERIVSVNRAEEMLLDRLSALLWREMRVLLSEMDLDGDKRIEDLTRKEIGDILEYLEGQESQRLEYVDLGIEYDGSRGRVVVVSFESESGDIVRLTVSKWIHDYLNWTQLAGGVAPEVIDDEVSGILSQYDIEANVIYRIQEKVRKVLEEEGVLFYENS